MLSNALQLTVTIVNARALLQRVGRGGHRAGARRRKHEAWSGIWAHAGPSASAIVGAGPPWIDAAVSRTVGMAQGRGVLRNTDVEKIFVFSLL